MIYEKCHMKGGDIMIQSYEDLLVENQVNKDYDKLTEWFENFQDVEFDIPREFYLKVSKTIH